MIRYLEGWEKDRCIGLWNEAFPEDSTPFVDYYFKEKTKDNRVLVREGEGGVIAMLHRNPYRVYMRGAEAVCDYIVGVATKIGERHKGHMRTLMLKALQDMRGEGMPFTFLMPAREAIYRPFDFRFIFDQPRWVLHYGQDIRRERLSGSSLLGELSDWQNAWLKRQYDVFAVRDESYLLRMQAELASEDGYFSLIYDGDEFIGMEAEWGFDERVLRCLYTGERYRAEALRKPAIMARIVNLPEFVRQIRLGKDCPRDEVTAEIGVIDMIIPQNQGTWLWELKKDRSRLTQQSRFTRKSGSPVFTIAELTQWLFGYETPGQSGKLRGLLENLPYGEYIEPFNGVFLDETV